MRKLTIFDDGAKIATITFIDGSIFIFARSTREWREMRRLVDSIPSKSLEKIAQRAHSFNYNTELVGSD